VRSLSLATLLISLFCVLRAPAQNRSDAARPQSATHRAWELLDRGVTSNSAETRRVAVAALGVVINNVHVIRIAEKSLRDENPRVRAAAATALGSMKARASIPKLIVALNDKEPEVVLAAAQALISLNSQRGYQVYYEVLTGERKGGKNAVEHELDVLKDPKKLAEMGVEEGIGFVPFGGMGLEAFHALRGGTAMGVRAAAAAMLAHDPDGRAATALSDATADPSWHVRVAAIKAIAERGDPRLVSTVLSGLDDDKEAIRFAAAAAVLRLSTAKPHEQAKPVTTASLAP
jgi:HEAT repeat protein